MMEINEISKIVFEEVCYIQGLSGRQIPMGFDSSIVPHKQVDGFDSLNGAEAAVRIGERCGCALPTNPFADGNLPLTIDQIAKNIMKKIDKGGRNVKRKD